MKYSGSCHCQKVRIEFETDLKEVMACNCSICLRRGHLLAFGPASNFKLLTDRSALTDYQWGKKSIHFYFCSTCGCAPFGQAEMPDGPAVAVNARCLENIDLEKIPVVHFDGKHNL
jgi:hypothetical protein